MNQDHHWDDWGNPYIPVVDCFGNLLHKVKYSPYGGNTKFIAIWAVDLASYGLNTYQWVSV